MQERGVVERAGTHADSDDDISFPVASTSTLSRLLAQPPPSPPSLRGDEAAARRHELAAAVHNSWTARGTEIAGLAERFLDGSIDALDELVLGDANGEIRREEEEDDAFSSSSCRGPAVAVADAATFSYDDFVSRFMEPGLPVIIKGAANSWRASREWRENGPSGLPLPLALAAAASPCAVAPVVDCGGGGGGDENGGGCRGRVEMSVREFAERWVALEKEEAGAGGEAEDSRNPYLKDWHFCLPVKKEKKSSDDAETSSSPLPPPPSSPALLGGHAAWYSVPEWFRDDWLNGALLAGVRLRGQEEEEEEGKEGNGGGSSGGGGGGGGGGSRRERGVEEPDENGDDEEEEKRNPNVEDDFRFIYAGPSSTTTPLHADVLSSYSWSANVAGRKRWRLLAPEKTHLLFDRFGRELAPSFLAPEASGSSPSSSSSSSTFPQLHLASRHVSEVIQEPGEAIFVPSGWHHTVENLGKGKEDGREEEEEDESGNGGGNGGGDEKSPRSRGGGGGGGGGRGGGHESPPCGGAISINHNWFNAHSLHWIWSLLKSERKAAAEAIEDCRSTTTALEFESLVQRNLGASAGMDFAGLAGVLEWGCRRAERRLERLLQLLLRGGREGRDEHEEEGGERGDEEISAAAARVLACRLDASRAAAVASGLEEDLIGAEAPAVVSRAIRAAKRAAERALKAAEIVEALGMK